MYILDPKDNNSWLIPPTDYEIIQFLPLDYFEDLIKKPSIEKYPKEANASISSTNFNIKECFGQKARSINIEFGDASN